MFVSCPSTLERGETPFARASNGVVDDGVERDDGRDDDAEVGDVLDRERSARTTRGERSFATGSVQRIR